MALEITNGTIEKLDLRPNDVVVVRVDAALSAEQFETMKAEISKSIPRGVNILILDRTATIGVLKAVL